MLFLRMEPQAVIDYLHGALGRSYHKGEAILDILIAGMDRRPDCLTRRDCEYLVRSVQPFLKDPDDVDHVLTLLHGGRAPEVDALRATRTLPKATKVG
jgi:hypothetical protein